MCVCPGPAVVATRSSWFYVCAPAAGIAGLAVLYCRGVAVAVGFGAGVWMLAGVAGVVDGVGGGVGLVRVAVAGFSADGFGG